MGTMIKEQRKTDSFSCAYYVKALQNETIRTDHPQQRESDQWSNEYRDGLIATILKDEDIPYIVICEQVTEKGINNYLIDGIQRITTIYNFRNGVFNIGKNVEDPIIEYETIVKDENGSPVRDDDGDLVREIKEFDIRGKGYKNLPEELKQQFDEYKIMETKHLNCSDDKIGYHLRRYNHAKNMGTSQKSITYLNKNIAERVKEIASNHVFFKDAGHFKPSEYINDTFCRVILETIMASNFINDWKTQLRGICTYLNSHITDKMIDTFENEINMLSECLIDNKSIAKLFTSKDSFLLISAFHKANKEHKINAEEYIKFLNEFNCKYKYEDVNGNSFVELNKTSTKKKNMIIAKLDIIDHFINEYFGENSDCENNIDKESSVLNFLIKNVDSDIIQDDIEFYEECLSGYDVDVSEANKVKLIGLVAYAFKHDVEIGDWFESRYNMFSNRDNIEFEKLKADINKFFKINLSA